MITHESIINELNKLDWVYSLNDYFDEKNNKSHFTVRYNFEDKYNYTRMDFNIDYSNNVLFISDIGCSIFKNKEDILNKIIKIKTLWQ